MLNYFKNLEWGMSFADWVNIYTESFGILYNLICMYLIFIAILIMFWIGYILKKQTYNTKSSIMLTSKKFIANKKYTSVVTWLYNNYLQIYDKQELISLEATWSLIPLSYISMVSIPSIGLEYGINPDVTPLVTVKVVGQQWYWHYEIVTNLNPSLIESADIDIFTKSASYQLFIEKGNNCAEFLNEFENLNYMNLQKILDITLIQNDPGFLRLVSLDNKLVLPMNTPIKLIITSIDVLHSFALPSGAIKIDAIPGRLSEQVIVLERPGLFWGQCSELCGPYHGFMPIVIEVATFEKFIQYMLNN